MLPLFIISLYAADAPCIFATKAFVIGDNSIAEYMIHIQSLAYLSKVTASVAAFFFHTFCCAESQFHIILITVNWSVWICYNEAFNPPLIIHNGIFTSAKNSRFNLLRSGLLSCLQLTVALIGITHWQSLALTNISLNIFNMRFLLELSRIAISD